MSENDHRAELRTLAAHLFTQRRVSDDETSEQHDADPDREGLRLVRRLFHNNDNPVTEETK